MKLKLEAEQISNRIAEQYLKFKSKGGRASNLHFENITDLPTDLDGAPIVDGSETKEQIQKRIEAEISRITDPRLLKKVMYILEKQMKDDETDDQETKEITIPSSPLDNKELNEN